MTRDRKEMIDMTYLSIDKTTERGVLHRDLLGHMLRWTHVLRYLKPQVPSRILEIGCGIEAPLAKTLYSNRHTKHKYCGIDYGPISPSIKFSGDFQPVFLPNKDASKLTSEEVIGALGDKADLVVSHECAEHMQPDRWLRILRKAILASTEDAVFLISTPCFDVRVGPADNHINEWKYEILLGVFEAMGLQLVENWGTFASQRDYKDLIHDKFGDGGQAMFELFKSYFDTNVLSCVMAPLFPENSRNVQWQLGKGEADTSRLAALVASSTGPMDLGQSTDVASWTKLVDLLKIPHAAWMDVSS